MGELEKFNKGFQDFIDTSLRQTTDLIKENTDLEKKLKDCQIRGHRNLITSCEDCREVIDRMTFKEPIVEQRDSWISVKKRMPKIDEFPRNEVLTWDGKSMSVSISRFYDNGYSSFFTCGGPPVTHWHPLPGAPK